MLIIGSTQVQEAIRNTETPQDNYLLREKEKAPTGI